MVNSSFVSDTEWNTWINRGLQDIYGLTAQVYGGHYYVADPAYTFVTDGINQKFALPTDFFKLLGVAVQVSSPQQFVPLRPFAIADRFRASMFNTIIPAAGQTVQLEYVPRLTALTQDADPVPDALSMNGWSEYAVAYACMLALTKEESDASMFTGRLAQLTERINAEADNRDAANPAHIVDVQGRRARAMQYQLWGSKLWLVGGVTPGWAYDCGDWNGLDDFGGDGFY
jgi:hypothetical protein